MIKADVPLSDPKVAAAIGKIRSRFHSGGYQPELNGGSEIYEAAVVGMVLANLAAESRRSELELIVQFLVGQQKANGSWDYELREQGDTSISQYAVLGLWEAENGGADVPPGVWDRAASLVPVDPGARRELDLSSRRGRSTRDDLDDRRGRRQPADLPAATGRNTARAAGRRRASSCDA